MKTLKERFYEKFIPVTESGCWIWTASISTGGYGKIHFGGPKTKLIGAHRVSWIIHFGNIPDKLEVCHKCDIPLCVNPNHLFLGTRKENMQDAIHKGKVKSGNDHYAKKDINSRMYGEKNGQSKLSKNDILLIRSMHKNGFSIKYISNCFNIFYGHARKIISREVWSHI